MFQLGEEFPTFGEQSATTGDEGIGPLASFGGAPPRFGCRLGITINFCLLRQNHPLSVIGVRSRRDSSAALNFAVERTKTSSCCASPFVVPKISIVASTAAARNCRAVRDGDHVVNLAAARIEGCHVVNASSVRIDGIRCCCMLWRRITMNLLRKSWARKRNRNAKSRYRELRV